MGKRRRWKVAVMKTQTKRTRANLNLARKQSFLYSSAVVMIFSVHQLNKKEPLAKRLFHTGGGKSKRTLNILYPVFSVLRLTSGNWKKVLALGTMIGRPLYRLGKRMHKRREREIHLKRAFTMGVAIVVALTIALLTFSLLLKISGFSMGSLLKVSGTPIGKTMNNVTNILLLGEGDVTGENLIDTIIVASVDPQKTRSVALLSLPRDLYFLNTNGKMKTKKGKINALWRDNAIAHMKEDGMEVETAGDLSLTELGAMIGEALNMPIHHVIKIDFTAAEEVIDAIGGIDIVVPETIHDIEFPGPNYTYETFHIDAGEQHINGETALKYARTRSTTSDFDRSHRQQQILRSAAEKARDSGLLKQPRKIIELYSILSKHIQTDLKTRQLVTLADIAKSVQQDRFLALQLNNVNGLYDEQQWKGGILYSPPRNLFDGDFVLLPVSIPEFPVTWKQVQTLARLYFGNRDLYLAKPTFAVLNGGAPEGSAGKVSRELTKFGFDVVRVRNVPGKREIDTSFIAIHTEESEHVGTFFADFLSLPKQELSAEIKNLRCSDDECLSSEFGSVTLVLGKDFDFQYFQDIVGAE